METFESIGIVLGSFLGILCTGGFVCLTGSPLSALMGIFGLGMGAAIGRQYDHQA